MPEAPRNLQDALLRPRRGGHSERETERQREIYVMSVYEETYPLVPLNEFNRLPDEGGKVGGSPQPDLGGEFIVHSKQLLEAAAWTLKSVHNKNEHVVFCASNMPFGCGGF